MTEVQQYLPGIALMFGIFTFPFACAALAMQKNRSATKWFIGACLSSLVAFLILLVMPNGKQENAGAPQKFLGLPATPKQLCLIAGVLFVLFAYGSYSLGLAVQTIISAMRS